MKTNGSISNINGGCISSDMLLKYVKGELSGLERNQIERHLTSCEMCSDELEGLSLLADPNAIVEIESNLNRGVDEDIIGAEKQKPVWGFYLRIAASIILLVGVSSLIYIRSFKDSQKKMTAENIAYDISKPSEIKDVPKAETNVIDGIAKTKKQEFSQTEALKRMVQANKSQEERKELEVKYVAPVVVDSVSVNEDVSNDEIAELVVADKLDTLSLTGGISVSEKQVATEAFAPVKASSAEKKELLNASSKITIRGATSLNYNSRKGMALSQYLIGNYKLALSSFREIDNLHPGIDSIQFYISMSRYNLNQFKESVDGFKKLSQDSNGSFFSEAQWYYALSLIKLGKINKADSVLRSIIDTNPKYKADALKELEEIKK